MGIPSTIFVITIVYLSYWVGLFIGHRTQAEVKVGKTHLKKAYYILTAILILLTIIMYHNIPGLLIAGTWIIITYYLQFGDYHSRSKWGYAISLSVFSAVVASTLSPADSISLISIMVVLHVIRGSLDYTQCRQLSEIVTNKAAVFYYLLLAWTLGITTHAMVQIAIG